MLGVFPSLAPRISAGFDPLAVHKNILIKLYYADQTFRDDVRSCKAKNGVQFLGSAQKFFMVSWCNGSTLKR
jgi:hypothetical protein